MISDWWSNRPDERFWLEVTGRTDVGTNLKAPQKDERGQANWTYSLLSHLRRGDLVFHYQLSLKAIIGYSVVASGVWQDEILWAARSLSAREQGIRPHTRPGWYVGLEGFTELTQPVDLDAIRAKAEAMRRSLDALSASTGKVRYFPFERGLARPVRPVPGYLFKLPSFFVELFSLLGGDSRTVRGSPVTPRSSLDQWGAEYRHADETTSVATADPFQVDPALMERGTRAHAATQNALASFLLSAGLLPRSASHGHPNFDLAWLHGSELFVAEVKSLTGTNEEKQLRLGLGQILRYRHSLEASTQLSVRPVLVVERRPNDSSWIELCEGLGVQLLWPKKFQRLLDD